MDVVPEKRRCQTCSRLQETGACNYAERTIAISTYVARTENWPIYSVSLFTSSCARLHSNHTIVDTCAVNTHGDPTKTRRRWALTQCARARAIVFRLGSVIHTRVLLLVGNSRDKYRRNCKSCFLRRWTEGLPIGSPVGRRRDRSKECADNNVL